MKEKRIPTQAGSSSRWEQLEECMREHVQQLIQALWEEEVRALLERPKSARRRGVDAPGGYRIGINVGDVIVEGERIYGDGVNIAARLEGLAEPGGICIAGTAHDQVKNKLVLKYEDLGEQPVKNIAEPVRVWRVVMEPAAAAGHKVPSPPAGEGQGERASGRAGVAKTPHPNLPPQGGKEPKEKRRGQDQTDPGGTGAGGVVGQRGRSHLVAVFSDNPQSGRASHVPAVASQALHCRAALCQHE